MINRRQFVRDRAVAGAASALATVGTVIFVSTADTVSWLNWVMMFLLD